MAINLTPTQHRIISKLQTGRFLLEHRVLDEVPYKLRPGDEGVNKRTVDKLVNVGLIKREPVNTYLNNYALTDLGKKWQKG